MCDMLRISKSWRVTVTCGPRLLDPVCQVTNKVEEEIPLRNADDLIRDLDKQTEPLA